MAHVSKIQLSESIQRGLLAKSQMKQSIQAAIKELGRDSNHGQKAPPGPFFVQAADGRRWRSYRKCKPSAR